MALFFRAIFRFLAPYTTRRVGKFPTLGGPPPTNNKGGKIETNMDGGRSWGWVGGGMGWAVALGDRGLYYANISSSGSFRSSLPPSLSPFPCALSFRAIFRFPRPYTTRRVGKCQTLGAPPTIRGVEDRNKQGISEGRGWGAMTLLPD